MHISMPILSAGLQSEGHDRRYAIDASKLERELGWRAIENFESGLDKTVKWYIDRRDRGQAILDRGYRARRLGLGGGDPPRRSTTALHYGRN